MSGESWADFAGRLVQGFCDTYTAMVDVGDSVQLLAHIGCAQTAIAGVSNGRTSLKDRKKALKDADIPLQLDQAKIKAGLEQESDPRRKLEWRKKKHQVQVWRDHIKHALEELAMQEEANRLNYSQ